MGIDIFSPQVSVLSDDLSGKTILLYGTNRTGKTKQATRFPKPYYWAFERGINGIQGVDFQPIQKFSDYIQLVKQLTKSSNLEKAKERWQTIIIDTVEVAGNMCSDFICEKYGVDRIGDGNKGYGLWKEYSQEFEKWLHLLTSAGFTVVFIAHEGTRDFTDENGEVYSKLYPKGDKRVVDPICDLVDIIAYAGVNGVDETGVEKKSSLYLTQTKKYHAGSRFDYLTPYIEEFTAENLENAIKEAVQKQLEVEGGRAVDHTTQNETYTRKEKTFEEIKEAIGEIALRAHEEGKADEYTQIVESHLGTGKLVSEATSKQKQQLILILADLEDSMI